jgi:hypothetical protein
MLRAVEGHYRDGKIELSIPVPPSFEGKVIVTFLQSGGIDLAELGISEAEAAEIRGRMSSFIEDWERPEMDVYDEL